MTLAYTKGSSALVKEGVFDPSCAEAFACREALHLAQDLHIKTAVIACDSATVVKNISEGTQGANAMIIAEIRKLLETSSDISFICACRESNVDAHNIAKNTLELAPGRHVCLLDPSNYVNNVLMQ